MRQNGTFTYDARGKVETGNVKIDCSSSGSTQSLTVNLHATTTMNLLIKISSTKRYITFGNSVFR